MAAKAGDAAIVPRTVWNDAEARLGLMEEESGRALRNRAKMSAIMVTVPDEFVSPLVLPDRGDGITAIERVAASKLLLGPDGNPLS